MRISVIVSGCFPALRGLSTQQFINAIEPRLIDIRNPLTGLQIDLFGRVTAVHADADRQTDADTIRADIEIDDAFLDRHQLTPALIQDVIAARITKLRHPGTGAMAPVQARLA